MAGTFDFRRKQGPWSKSGPTIRLILGSTLIAAVGLFGLTRNDIFGLSFAWPHAALWGAVGWGRVGLSIRPMLVLIVFGVMQDVIFHAPFGCFEVVNLLTYAGSTAIASQFDVMSEPLIAITSSVLLFAGAFLLLWLMASTLEDHAVRILPLIAAMLTTGLLYALIHRAFDLGRRPGETPGQAA
ncbi:MAG TPA: hypothetical protein PLR76_07830 [Hyphomonas sp.]|nr:hypothetical protein [Hyphomonas sp.]MCA8903847.1 hypothetical protein [Hyphomonas sp.]MCB9960904.1 hypothetical protein [Hyphomonas sp.]MCB9970195.1 hypothetical protein [Hyphomonas sp.]HPE48289.1 hypothetical protein [Hyphomonas sp.]